MTWGCAQGCGMWGNVSYGFILFGSPWSYASSPYVATMAPLCCRKWCHVINADYSRKWLYGLPLEWHRWRAKGVLLGMAVASNGWVPPAPLNMRRVAKDGTVWGATRQCSCGWREHLGPDSMELGTGKAGTRPITSTSAPTTNYNTPIASSIHFHAQDSVILHLEWMVLASKLAQTQRGKLMYVWRAIMNI